MIGKHYIVIIDYILIAITIPSFILLSLYMWIKTIKKPISKLSLIIFSASFATSIALFFLFLFGVLTTDTEIPGFITRYVEGLFTKESIDISTLSYVAWFFLLFSWWYIMPKIIKYRRFSFLKRYRKSITLFLSSHQLSAVVSFSFIYFSLLLISVVDFFAAKNNYWLLLLFYWSVFVLFTAAPPYVSATLDPHKR